MRRIKHLFTPSISVDAENKKVEMTFRSEEFIKHSSKFTITSVSPGQKVDGIVKKVENYGLFIQIDGSKLQGLCHKSEVCRFSPNNIHANLSRLAFRQ